MEFSAASPIATDISPSFTDTSGFLFFLIALFYFCKWEKQKDFARLNTNLFLQILFLSLAVYARQLYAIVFLYMVYLYYLRLNFKTFFLVCSVILIVSLPAILSSLFKCDKSNSAL